ncbi:hypothetical protein MN608_11696 [Microdochium nivale]|nr:hypothetical protein MN608_11696 [Microdochium nivale]
MDKSAMIDNLDTVSEAEPPSTPTPRPRRHGRAPPQQAKVEEPEKPKAEKPSTNSLPTSTKKQRPKRSGRGKRQPPTTKKLDPEAEADENDLALPMSPDTAAAQAEWDPTARERNLMIEKMGEAMRLVMPFGNDSGLRALLAAMLRNSLDGNYHLFSSNLAWLEFLVNELQMTREKKDREAADERRLQLWLGKVGGRR